jgi:hypothetical protein
MGIIVSCLVSLVVGGLITWLAARCYYLKSSKDLRNESQELRRLNRIMLLGMENAGFIELSKDASGKIIGLNVKIIVPSIQSGEQFGIPSIIVQPAKKKN